MEDRTIHEMDQRLESTLRRIRGEKVVSKKTVRDYSNCISPENREIILKFLNKATARVDTITRVTFYANHLWILGKIIKTSLNDKNLRDLDKDDVDKIISTLKTMKSKSGKPYSEHSVHDMLVSLKKIVQFVKGYEWNSKKYPPEVEDIRTSMKKRDLVAPEELITLEEIEKLCSVSRNIRDIALIRFLYESGTRAGEALKLKIKDVVFDDYGAKINVPYGKTGRRMIRICTSSTVLAKWINHHPKKDNPDAWVWCRIGEMNPDGNVPRLTYGSLRNIIARLKEKANIKKRVHAHLLRKSRLTELAKSITESQLSGFAGWVQGSEMSRTYVRLSMRDIDDAILQANGIKRQEATTSPTISCPRCSSINSSATKLCQGCELPLDNKTIIEFEQRKSSILTNLQEEVVLEVLSKPEIMELLRNKLKERKKVETG